MDFIVKADDGNYARYEELILKRDEVKKRARQYSILYIHEFGEAITALFEEKVRCIKVKRYIGYCISKINARQDIDAEKMEEQLEKEMAQYYAALKEMAEKSAACRELKRVPEADAAAVKQKYRQLVKKLHPDINPKTSENKVLSELWQRLVTAYETSDIEETEEVEVLINNALEALGEGAEKIVIPDIEEKIKKIGAQIEKITSTDPYRYKFLLEDAEAVKAKKKALADELKEYKAYKKELEEKLDEILINSGVRLSWRMK